MAATASDTNKRPRTETSVNDEDEIEEDTKDLAHDFRSCSNCQKLSEGYQYRVIIRQQRVVTIMGETPIPKSVGRVVQYTPKGPERQYKTFEDAVDYAIGCVYHEEEKACATYSLFQFGYYETKGDNSSFYGQPFIIKIKSIKFLARVSTSSVK